MPTHVEVMLENESAGYGIGTWIEECDPDDTLGDLYRMAQAEYGRCTSKVYRETGDGEVIGIGWTFVKRVKYQDDDSTYLQTAWVVPLTKVADPIPAQYDTHKV
jgi:hypothetical protein